MEEQEVKQSKVELTNFFGNNTVASSVMIAGILIAISVIAGAFIVTHGGVGGSAAIPGQKALPAQNIKLTDRADQPSIGNPNAPVTVYEFGDFQCPYCKQFFQQSFATLKSTYIDTGKIRLVFRQFPLTQIHVNAEISSEAAECASRQGQFEPYFETLYTKGQGDGTGLDVTSLKSYASAIGLNMTVFNQCLDNHETKAVVAADEALGSSIGIQGTPSFAIVKNSDTNVDVTTIKQAEQSGQNVVMLSNGNVFLAGAQPTAAFEQALDSVLK